MTSRMGRTLFAALALVLAPVVANAQKPVELGVDLGFAYQLSNNYGKYWTLTTPVDLRAGFMMNDNIELEPRVTVLYAKPSGGSSFHQVDAILGLLYHLSTDRTRSQIYIRPFAELQSTGGGGNSLSQFGFGGGLGVKLPASDRMAWRIEGGFSTLLKKSGTNGAPSASFIYALFGFSFFTH